MVEFLKALGEYAFLQHALAGGVLASIGCGVMGSYVVVKRISFLSGGIAHTVLGGMGVALFYGLNPISGALVTALLAAVLIGLITLHRREQEDTLIGVLWALGMAIGILFITKTPGYQADVMSYLFGNISLIQKQDLWRMLLLDGAIIATVALCYRQLTAVVFDDEFAQLRGVSTTGFYLLLLCMVALTVVLLIQIVGLIMVMALLTIPAAIAGHYTHTLGRMMALAMLLGMLFTSLGLAVAYLSDMPAGAIIIVIAGSAYLLSTLLLSARHSWGRSTS